MGLLGLLLISKTGAKLIWIPNSFNCLATSEPKSVGLPQTISGWDPEKLAGIDVTGDIIEQLKLH